MTRLGFRPTRTDHGSQVSLVLGNCPVADVAAAEPQTICLLHLGLAEGLAEGLGGLAVEELTARDAHHAGCRLTFRRTPAPVRPQQSPAGDDGDERPQADQPGRRRRAR